MPSSYTPSLRLTLPATGELAGQWGSTVNTGITELLDAAVAGTTVISTWGGAGVPYTLSNNAGTADEARRMFIVATGAPGEAKNVICPAVSKLYVFRNDTTGGFALTLKTPSGTGVSVPAGQYKMLYCDGTNVVEAVNSPGPVASLSASQAVFTDGSKNLVSNAVTGTGNVVMSASPTLTGTVAGASLQLSSLTSGRVTYAGASGLLQDSTNLTFDGTSLTLGGDPTLSAGTANGVLYLNGSKVATSGSALTFDGTNLTTTGYAAGNGLRSLGGNAVRFYNAANANWSQISAPAGTGDMQFDTGAGEQMRLTNTGLGIGTSSPVVKLDVNGALNLAIGNNLTWGGAYGAGTPTIAGSSTGGGTLLFYPAGSTSGESMRLDSSGNLGLGVTPSAWGLGKAFEVGALGNAVWGGAGYVDLMQNVAYTSGAYRYSTTAAAARYEMQIGTHAWFTAPSGTAGNAITFTQAMLLDSSGNLGLGVTPSAWGTNFRALELQYTSGGSVVAGQYPVIAANTYNDNTNWIYKTTAAASYYSQVTGQHRWYTAPSGTAGNAISFTQSMTLDASGNLGVGTTSTSGGRLWVDSGATSIVANFNSTAANGGYIRFQSSGATYGDIGTAAEVVGGSASDFGINARGSRNLIFGTNNTERMRIDSAGNLGIGTASPAYRLDVYSDSIYCANLKRTTAGGNAALRFETGDGNIGFVSLETGGNLVLSSSTGGGVVAIASSRGLSISRTAVTAPAASDGNVFSGTYTPTLYTVGTNNVSAATATSCQYMRVGNTVTVSGRVLITPAVANTYTRLDLSLPISTTLINIGDLSGVSHVSTTAVSEIQSGGGAISAETTNSRATIAYAPTVASNRSIAFTFTYRVA